MDTEKLKIQQLNQKIKGLVGLKDNVAPLEGWVKAIRTALGMSLQQLGNRLNMSKQGVLDIEKREKEGAITIKALRDVANAMDMEFVYGFVPKAGSIDALIEKRAQELATKIVLRTAQTMLLEGQANSEKRIKAAISERTFLLKNELPKALWD